MKKGTLLAMMFLVVVALHGQQCWKKQFDWMSSNPQAQALQMLSGNYYLFADNRLVCINSSGNLQWHKDFDLYYIYAFDTSTDGKLLVGGKKIIGDTLISGFVVQQQIGVLLKVALDGQVLWERTFLSGSYSNSTITSIITTQGSTLVGLSQTGSGGVATFGLLELGPNGNTISQVSLPQYGDGQFIGANNGLYHLKSDRLLYLNNQWDTIWLRDDSYFGVASINKVVPLQPSGGIVLGNSAVKFDANGNMEWSFASIASDAIQVADGLIILHRVQDGTIHHSAFVRATKLNTQGIEQWHINLTKPNGLLVSGLLRKGAVSNTIFFCDHSLNYVVQTDSTGYCVALPADTITPASPFVLGQISIRGTWIMMALCFFRLAMDSMD